MARGPAERAEANISEPPSDDGQDEAVSILLTSEKARNDERQSQASEGGNPRGLDSDENIHYPKLPASTSTGELTGESHNTKLRDTAGGAGLKIPTCHPRNSSSIISPSSSRRF